MIDARDVVLNILSDIENNNTFSNIAITKALKKNQFEAKQDRAFITRLSEGVVETKIKLDYIIDKFSKKPSEKCKPLIRLLLRMGVYQIMYMDYIPDSAVCNEAVKLAKKHGFANLSGFVNGVLRNIARNKDGISMPDKKDRVKYFSVTYSTPEWLCEKILKDYGADGEKILAASFDERKTTIRVNTVKTTKAWLTEYINSEIAGRTAVGDKTSGSIVMENGYYDENALLISGYDFIRSIPGYRQGLFSVQDESSMCAVRAANIKPYDVVVDVCGAPGGKSLCAAEYMQGKGEIYLRDISEDKLDIMEENVERLGFSDIVHIEKWDAAVPDERLVKRADVVIADLPCSGLGIMGRKNDIKYRITKEQINELVFLQRSILSTVREYVKSGGILLYSTCTINPEENEKNTEWFLKENKDFECEKEHQFLQGTDKCDGFYYAVLKRTGR